MKYRKDIDGLRAIAVGSVVLYHCGFARFIPGGFVGVDIFFVLSGYLISGIIKSDMAKDKFSIVSFYNRRVRRIFPALFTMYAAVILACFFIYMPYELDLLENSIVSSILVVSNIFFYFNSGYFDVDAQTNPLLHTWSLSVEEQFYIFFPFLLKIILSIGERKRLFSMIIILFTLFSLAWWMVFRDMAAAFYLVQYRAWELLLGATFAVGIVPSFNRHRVAEVAALLGFMLISASFLMLHTTTPFPGLSALPVTLGTCLLLHSGKERTTITSRALSISPIRGIGLVSYSFYLWHWPIWVLGYRVYEPRETFTKLTFIIISLIFAILSWRYIERPFRTAPFRFRERRTLLNAAIAMSAVLLVNMSIREISKRYWQVPDQVERVAAFTNYNSGPTMREGHCFLTSSSPKFEIYAKNDCLMISDTQPNILLLGDSHAAHLYWGLAKENPNFNILQGTASGCKPLRNTHGTSYCVELIDFLLTNFIPKKWLQKIILSARWNENEIPELIETVKFLRQFTDEVVVMGPIAEYDIALPRVLAQSLYKGQPSLIAKHRDPGRRSMDIILKAAVTPLGIRYISLYDALCSSSESCTTWTTDGNPIQFDYSHLTAEGSRLIADRIRKDL